MLTDVDCSFNSESVCQSLNTLDNFVLAFSCIKDMLCSRLLAKLESFVTRVNSYKIDAFSPSKLDAQMTYKIPVSQLQCTVRAMDGTGNCLAYRDRLLLQLSPANLPFELR